jgi:hypothetical protein
MKERNNRDKSKMSNAKHKNGLKQKWAYLVYYLGACQ